jgi:hypothetical protein
MEQDLVHYNQLLIGRVHLCILGNYQHHLWNCEDNHPQVQIYWILCLSWTNKLKNIDASPSLH